MPCLARALGAAWVLETANRPKVERLIRRVFIYSSGGGGGGTNLGALESGGGEGGEVQY